MKELVMETMSFLLTLKSQLDFPSKVDQCVGNFHISLPVVVFFSEACHVQKNCHTDPLQGLFRNLLGFFQYLAHGATIHILHADTDLPATLEVPVAAHDVQDVAFRMANLIT